MSNVSKIDVFGDLGHNGGVGGQKNEGHGFLRCVPVVCARINYINRALLLSAVAVCEIPVSPVFSIVPVWVPIFIGVLNLS